MKRLLLLRHAKAEADGKETRDFERRLTGRGRSDAAAMGAWLHRKDYQPYVVLCSAAVRTRETWTIASAEMGGAPKVEFLERLYLAPVKRMLAIIREATGARDMLVIGHNSGLEECAASLARKPQGPEEAGRFDDMREKFPTCALAVLEFDIDAWHNLEPDTGTLAAFVKPKDIEA